MAAASNGSWGIDRVPRSFRGERDLVPVLCSGCFLHRNRLEGPAGERGMFQPRKSSSERLKMWT